MAIEHSYNAQDRFSEELELAIDAWKQAMNTEISKAKEVADELQKQLRQRTLFEPGHPNLQVSSPGFVDQSDLKNYIAKVGWSKTQLIFSCLVPILSCSQSAASTPLRIHVCRKTIFSLLFFPLEIHCLGSTLTRNMI